jgi:multisubunit Na+/H+ antiporter MnhB subunit
MVAHPTGDPRRTIGWTEAAFRSSEMVGFSRRRSVTLNVRCLSPCLARSGIASEMRFTIRELFLAVTLFAAWFALIVQGHRRLGFSGVLVFGSFFGLSLVLLGTLARCWQRWSIAERSMCIFAIMLSLCAGIGVAMIYFRTLEYRFRTEEYSWPH